MAFERLRTDLVEATLVREDGDVSVVAACLRAVSAIISVERLLNHLLAILTVSAVYVQRWGKGCWQQLT